jgi:nucleotide-binding universal stress UspA family protein
MIKTILVPTSGSHTDVSVFATALALARPLAAHLEFCHLRLTLGEAAVRAPHAQLYRGSGMTDALEHLRQQDEILTANALKHFAGFCDANEVPVLAKPMTVEGVSANWSEETDQPEMRLMFHARHSDLVVLGRSRNVDLMPSNLIEMLLVGCGHPIVIAPERAPSSVTGTILVGWKETPQAARAVAAAMPLLKRAQRVVLAGIAEDDAASAESLDHLTRQLAWHGIAAETRLSGDNTRPAAQLLQAAAELHADLLVVGGFGHAPWREAMLGGATHTFIEHAELPVFIVH